MAKLSKYAARGGIVLTVFGAAGMCGKIAYRYFPGSLIRINLFSMAIAVPFAILFPWDSAQLGKSTLQLFTGWMAGCAEWNTGGN